MKSAFVPCILVLALAIAGCGPKAMLRNPSTRAQALDVIASDPELARAVAGRMVASDSTRGVVIASVLANSEARQELLLLAARERTMVEGMLNVAVQDTAMRDHVLTLVRGMQMGGMH